MELKKKFLNLKKMIILENWLYYIMIKEKPQLKLLLINQLQLQFLNKVLKDFLDQLNKFQKETNQSMICMSKNKNKKFLKYYI